MYEQLQLAVQHHGRYVACMLVHSPVTEELSNRICATTIGPSPALLKLSDASTLEVDSVVRSTVVGFSSRRAALTYTPTRHNALVEPAVARTLTTVLFPDGTRMLHAVPGPHEPLSVVTFLDALVGFDSSRNLDVWSHSCCIDLISAYCPPVLGADSSVEF